MNSQHVWDEYYKTHSQRLIYPDENLVRILEKQELTKFSSALDFGCGSGRHLNYLKQKNIKHLYGMDYSWEIIYKNQFFYKDIHFIYYDGISPLPFPENFFDIIICWGVLHYNDSKMRKFLLSEFYRVLKPKGLFTGTYRSKNDTHFQESAVRNAKIYFFDEKEIHRELNAMNFDQIQIGYTERTPLGNLHTKIAHYFFLCKK